MGFGICEKDCIHGDIEYFYEVIVPLGGGVLNRQKEDKKITIKVYKIDYKQEVVRKNFNLVDTIEWDGEV